MTVNQSLEDVGFDNGTTTTILRMADRELPLALTILRLARGWNQARLARGSGIRNSSISDYERGKKVPELTTLQRLVATMGYSLSTLERTQRFVATLHRQSEGRALPVGSDEREDVEWEQAAADLLRAISHLIGATRPYVARLAPGVETPERSDES